MATDEPIEGKRLLGNDPPIELVKQRLEQDGFTIPVNPRPPFKQPKPRARRPTEEEWRDDYELGEQIPSNQGDTAMTTISGPDRDRNHDDHAEAAPGMGRPTAHHDRVEPTGMDIHARSGPTNADLVSQFYEELLAAMAEEKGASAAGLARSALRDLGIHPQPVDHTLTVNFSDLTAADSFYFAPGKMIGAGTWEDPIRFEGTPLPDDWPEVVARNRDFAPDARVDLLRPGGVRVGPHKPFGIDLNAELRKQFPDAEGQIEPEREPDCISEDADATAAPTNDDDAIRRAKMPNRDDIEQRMRDAYAESTSQRQPLDWISKFVYSAITIGILWTLWWFFPQALTLLNVSIVAGMAAVYALAAYLGATIARAGARKAEERQQGVLGDFMESIDEGLRDLWQCFRNLEHRHGGAAKALAGDLGKILERLEASTSGAADIQKRSAMLVAAIGSLEGKQNEMIEAMNRIGRRHDAQKDVLTSIYGLLTNDTYRTENATNRLTDQRHTLVLLRRLLAAEPAFMNEQTLALVNGVMAANGDALASLTGRKAPAIDQTEAEPAQS